MPNNDLVFAQPPVMTEEHLDAMRQTVLLYSYADTMFRRSCLDEILAHLEALLAQPVPSREHVLTPYEVITHASNYTPPERRFTSWLKEYDHLDEADIQSDQ